MLRKSRPQYLCWRKGLEINTPCLFSGMSGGVKHFVFRFVTDVLKTRHFCKTNQFDVNEAVLPLFCIHINSLLALS